MNSFDDQPLDASGRREQRHAPSGGAIVAVVVVWMLGVPALMFVAGIIGLGAGFAADSGEEVDAGGAIAIVVVLGLVLLVGVTALVLGGLGDDDPIEPPAPYAGRPLSEVPPVATAWPAKRRTTAPPDRGD